MTRAAVLVLSMLAAAGLAACAAAQPQDAAVPTLLSPTAAPARDTIVPAAAPQGGLVIGRTAPDALVEVAGRRLHVTPYGSFVFGIGREATAPVVVNITRPGTSMVEYRTSVMPREWPIERVNGVPPATVNPPAAVAARIAREQAAVSAARLRDDARADFAQAFAWPVRGRISGRFGNQRIYNGTPGAAHSGMDIAAASGTPVLAPAAGTITFAQPDLYLTGGTLVLDHGHGVSSNFLHLSRLDVVVGDRVAQGQVIGAVGATGRATGPHLHWGMNWFDVRIDPLLLVDKSDATTPTR